VSLRDRAGRDLALAVVRAAGPVRIDAVTPLEDASGVVALLAGTLRVDPQTGREQAGV
jgi:hypothetical protein